MERAKPNLSGLRKVAIPIGGATGSAFTKYAEEPGIGHVYKRRVHPAPQSLSVLAASQQVSPLPSRGG
jgi:hypothetical protein